MYVIGTAGHVDHGKSTLVQALTGIDPDRLREEKERGLTIDLGFAWLKLPNGDEVSIVDVPGHERFIKNMLAGVGGIDVALLVIAADEGVMPQTQEHLAIIDLLGIAHGVVALTKADLVEPGLLELAKADAADAIDSTSLHGAIIVACSGTTRAGLDALLAALQSELEKTPVKRDIGRPRLPVDRAFTMQGFGTVVTGTLVDGSLRTGQEVEALPDGKRTRIRGLQSHGRKVDSAPPGRRTAVNLAGIPVDDLRRGMVITTPGWLKPASSLDVSLRAVRYLRRPIKHNLTITFHTGSAEVEGKILLLDRDEVPPGETALAQVRLSQPVAAVRGDRFIIRDPNDTLGGGRIIEAQVRRHRRLHEPTLAALRMLEKGSPEDLLIAAAERRQPVTLADLLPELDMDEDAARTLAEALVQRGDLIQAGEGPAAFLFTQPGFASLADRAQQVVRAYHEESPLRRGIPREELRSRLAIAPRPFDQVIARLVAGGALQEARGTIAVAGHEPLLTPEQGARAESYVASLRSERFAPSPPEALDSELLSYLEDAGKVVQVAEGVIFAADAYREMVDSLTQHLREHGSITLAQVRDMFATSRKFAQALLEHLDAEQITRRVGDERVLRKR